MTKYLFLSIVLFASLVGCRKAVNLTDVPYVEGANFEMSVTGAKTLERANLMKNMRIFLFTRDQGTTKGILKHEILNLSIIEGTGDNTQITSEHVQAGLWTMVAISNLSDSDVANNLDFEAKYSQTREQLLYQFTPGAIASPSVTNAGANCPEIVILSKDIEVRGGTAIQTVNASFQRAVGKVRVSIVSTTGNIKQNSASHMVEISDVPSHLSLYGGLLDASGAQSRKDHSVVNAATNPMKRPILVSPNVTTKPPVGGVENKFPAVDFIVPAYDDLAPNAVVVPSVGSAHTENKFIWINVDLETENPAGRYKNRVQISTASLSANMIMNVKLNVKAELTATVEIVKWGEILVDSDIAGTKITGASNVYRPRPATGTTSVSGNLNYVSDGSVKLSIALAGGAETEVALPATVNAPFDFTSSLPANVMSWITKATWTLDQAATDVVEAKGHFNFNYTTTAGSKEDLKLNLKTGNVVKRVNVQYYTVPVFADRNVGTSWDIPVDDVEALCLPANSRPKDVAKWATEIPRTWFTWDESLLLCKDWNFQGKKWRQPNLEDIQAVVASNKLQYGVSPHQAAKLDQSDGSTVYFPMVGLSYDPAGVYGRYWSSAPHSSYAYFLNVHSKSSYVKYTQRAYGFSARCVSV